MQFAKRNIYDQELKPKANQVFISAGEEGLDGIGVDLFEQFLSILIHEVDEHIDKFKLIIPDKFYPYFDKLDKTITRRLSVLVNVASRDQASTDLMMQISEAGYSLAIDVQDKQVLDTLPSETEFLIIDGELFEFIRPQIEGLNQLYKCVAKGVGDQAQYEALKDMGVVYFSGEFIERPKTLDTKTVSPNKTAILQLIAKLADPDVELEEVTKLVVADSILSFKIIKIINSPMYRGINEITSVQNAIVRFGFTNLKRWVITLSFCTMGDKPPSLIRTTLQRAIMCANLAKHLKLQATDTHYTAGLLSMLDAFLDQPLSELLKDLNLTPEITEGLLKGEGMVGKVLDIVKRYQNGDVSFNDSQLTNIFIEAATEVNDILKLLGM